MRIKIHNFTLIYVTILTLGKIYINLSNQQQYYTWVDNYDESDEKYD